jgi:lipopolysaccharide transport system ATP-binding protein
MKSKILLKDLYKVYSSSGKFGHEQVKTIEGIGQDGDKIAIAGINMKVEQGDRIGIIGRNGAGKSTLLHMIAGLSLPTSGVIEVNGKVTSVMTLGVGLRDDLSGRENIYVDGEIQGKSKQEIEKVIQQIIEFAELGEFIDYPIRTYSTGMKARLAFSMISHIDPEILIIDEALSVGDAAFSAKATVRIREICARGKIVIIVSHSMQSIKDICNRCLWMENGRVIMDGMPEVVTRAYIDSVRSADEAQLKERFRKLVGSRSKKVGWTVKQVVIFNGDLNESRNLLEAGLTTCIKIKANAPTSAKKAFLRIQIMRLDELIIFDESVSVDEFRMSDQSIGLEIKMDALALGVAIYKLDASLEEFGAVVAENTIIFEVFSTNLPRGGKPMLLYPIQLGVFPSDSCKEVFNARL